MIIFCVIDYLCYHIKAKLPKFLKFIGQSHSTIHREENFFFFSILLFFKSEKLFCEYADFSFSEKVFQGDNLGLLSNQLKKDVWNRELMKAK